MTNHLSELRLRRDGRLNTGGAGSYLVKNTASEPSELLIMPALPITVDKMRALLEELGKKQIENSKQSELTKLDREDPTPRELKGEQFSGFYTEFTSRVRALTRPSR